MSFCTMARHQTSRSYGWHLHFDAPVNVLSQSRSLSPLVALDLRDRWEAFRFQRSFMDVK